MSSIPPELGFGLYLPTTVQIDPQVIRETAVDSPAFKELLVRLYQEFNNLSQVVNLKESGYHPEEEFVCGIFFPPAQTSGPSTNLEFTPVFRKIIDFGALPNTGTKSVAHGITINAVTQPTIRFYRWHGGANDLTAPSYIPLPYASPILANNIELNADATHVNVITGSNRTNYTDTKITLEFVKS